jgi:protein-ribulosamine 3-kinase
MPGKHIENFLTQLLRREQGIPISTLNFRHVGGGSINNTYQVTINGSKNFFLKLNAADRYPGLFEKEKEGLRYLGARNCITVPAIIFCGKCENDQLLLLEWISPGQQTEQFWKKFGEQLARLHKVHDERCGFASDNYMGALPQKNQFMDRWTDFFIHCRLQPQVDLALGNGLLSPDQASLFQLLYRKLDTVFNTESPSLLHGDLWSGNFMCNESSEPVLIDPAVYYGHRSMDLAMTTLFGGFDAAFYQSYHYHFPLPPHHDEQWEICNLYPLLIHLNLFGQSYLGQIIRTLKRFQ